MQSRFRSTFSQLTENVQSTLAPILANELFSAIFAAEQVSALKNATGMDDDTLSFALLPARASLSNFNVGAIARGVSEN